MPEPNLTRQQLASNRKQNVACDACRAKKIRCARESTSEICAQCHAKHIDCTSNYVDGLQKAAVKKHRKTDNAEAGPSRHILKASRKRVLGDDAMSDEYPSPPAQLSRTASTSQHPTHPSESQLELLRYLFSAYAARRRAHDYNDSSDIELCSSGHSDIWESLNGRIYVEQPSAAHLVITGAAAHDLTELAEDLLETFLSIVHIRFPILDPDDVRSRFAQPDTHPNGPLSHPLLAVALAFGARFSENPAIVGDRTEISNREGGDRTRSRLVQLLVVRAREVCEVRKIHRIVTEENCATLILLEPLLGQSTFLKEKYQAYHAAAAGRHAAALGVMAREKLLEISDEKARMQSVYMWWMTGLSDGWRSVFNKLKPLFNDDDFDVDPPAFLSAPAAVPSGLDTTPGHSTSDAIPTDMEGHTILWFTAGNAGAFICRQLCHGLWTPRVHRKGIATLTLRDFVHRNSQWRDKYIAKLGVPADWPQEWDFLAAISSCSTEAYYHSLWMIVHQATDDFGLEAEKDMQMGAQCVEADSLRRRIMDESEHSALRVASLISVLTENGYLRLDPLILSHPAYIAGLILARAGRSECKSCIAGLRQYSIAFGHLWEAAEEVEQIYRSVTSSRNTSFSVPAGQGMGSMSVHQLIAPSVVQEKMYDAGVGAMEWQGREEQDGEWNVTGAGAHLVR